MEMNFIDWIGFIGVFLILLAYFLQLQGRISSKEGSFLFLNTIGAALALAASILLNYMPFVLLEGAWTLVSLVALIKHFRKK